jgi:hypothetical protein
MWYDSNGHRTHNSTSAEHVSHYIARIVTGLTSYVYLLSIYKKTGWEKLSVRREKRKLLLFYDIVSGQSPDYLQDLLPITVGQTTNYNLRNSRNFTIPPGRLSLYQSSFFPKYHQTLEQSANRLEKFSFNKMNCELMLTYDTPALRQTGSRNLTGQKNASHYMGYLYEACDQISDSCHQKLLRKMRI